MAARIVAMVLVVLTSWEAGVLGRAMGDCLESTYEPDAPSGNDSTVWLYVFKNSFLSLHSGIGTRGAYWAYGGVGDEDVNRFQSYTEDTCDGPLHSWHRLGRTNKTEEEVQAVVNDLVNTCYPGYIGCWKFVKSHFCLFKWNSNYFTHHLAAALDVVDNYPGFLWGVIPGLCWFC